MAGVDASQIITPVTL